MTLAAWDQNYNRVVPWLTPFDTPNLLSQMSQSDYVHADPLSTVGQWTYRLDYASSAIPPDGCSLQTNLDVSISPADETLGARVHNYTIRETNVGGQITASVTVEELADAVAISGEVIKAAIEYYFRRKAPADYMDHIYFADLGKNRVGEPIKPISSGNETFKRAGIADNFEIRVPGRLSFTIDSELELGADL